MEQVALIERIFHQKVFQPELALDVFAYQYKHNQVYHQWCNALHKTPDNVGDIASIPFLPISFFKTHEVTCGSFIPELVFESSGTTRAKNSQHLVRYAAIYQRSFLLAFEMFYGSVKDYCIVGLLPNYLEKGQSSLVKMVADLIEQSGHPDSGFYLYDYERLTTLLEKLEKKGQKTLLLGVTFALMDFADHLASKDNLAIGDNPHQEVRKTRERFKNTLIMDTGGMKGRKKELTRPEVHNYLQQRLGVRSVHSEYGMTELLSQAYSTGEGRYRCPPWMQVWLREESDPLSIQPSGKGLMNIIDLANLFSCSFIATDDVGSREGDYFEVWGRFDHTDLRGCSLLVVQ